MSSTRDVEANNLFWVEKLKIVHDSQNLWYLDKKSSWKLVHFYLQYLQKKKLILGVAHDSPVFA